VRVLVADLELGSACPDNLQSFETAGQRPTRLKPVQALAATAVTLEGVLGVERQRVHGRGPPDELWELM